MALVIASSGCTMKKEFDHASASFTEKVDHLVRVDDHNERLREENVRLKAENLRLQRKLAGQHQEERSSHVKSAAHHEGGTEASRVTHSLVPELVKGHGEHAAAPAAHQDEHAAKPAAAHHDEHAAAPAAHHDEHAAPASASHDEHTAKPAAHHDEHAAKPADADDESERSPASADEAEPAVTLLSAPPRKIFDTALAAFQREEYDRAARGFVSLANNKENTRYATPEVNFMAGVSLFKVRNYQVAIKHLDHVLTAKGAEAERFAPKALMWKALALKKLGRDSESRQTAQVIVERYPASAEAQKVK
jgi:TolA-binding protein